jgi:ipoprotein LpqH
MKHGTVVGVAGAAMVVASLVGCSSNKFDFTGGGWPQVIVDGQNRNITGQVGCTVNGDNINISIGDATNGVGAVISNANPPVVHSVGLGNVNGITLGFSDAAPNQTGNAEAARNGKSYTTQGHRDGCRYEQSAAAAASDQVIRDGT